MVIYTSAAFIRVARNMGSVDWVVTVLSGRRWSGFDLAWWTDEQFPARLVAAFGPGWQAGCDGRGVMLASTLR